MPDEGLTPKQLRSRIALELQEFANILLGEGICADPSPLSFASNSCRGLTGDRWGYSFSGLTLFVGDGVKCIPTPISDFVCRLDVKVEGVCGEAPPQSDPLREHQVEIELKAPNKAKPAIPFLQAWHFDRHPGNCSPPSGPKPAHPRYHFSFGGNRIKAHLLAIGMPYFEGLLLLNSPRLTHPPLDGVLAVDFVLSHFAGPKWRILSQQPAYRRIVSNSQELLWKPYALALNAHWSTDHASKRIWPIGELWPQVF